MPVTYGAITPIPTTVTWSGSGWYTVGGTNFFTSSTISASTTSYNITYGGLLQASPYIPQPELTAEQRAERERRDAERQAAAEAVTTRRAAALTRARATLLDFLTPDQRTSYEAEETIEIVGSAGGRYRIRPGSNGNVDWIDPATGRPAARLCAHPALRLTGWDDHLPGPDITLAQLLHLSADEADWLGTANIHAGGEEFRAYRRGLEVAR